MRKYLAIFLLSMSCTAMFSQQIKVELLNHEALETKISSHKDGLLVVNFWATTCAPCIKELPHFTEVNHAYTDNPGFKMLLVSLDRAKDMDRVLRFIKDKELTAEVVILDDNKRMNTWIPRFDADWGGEIPVTLFYKNGIKVKFHNGEITKEELEASVKEYIN